MRSVFGLNSGLTCGKCGTRLLSAQPEIDSVYDLFVTPPEKIVIEIGCGVCGESLTGAIKEYVGWGNKLDDDYKTVMKDYGPLNR